LLYVCLYYLMWGEAANVRFIPEGLCYIFHHVSLYDFNEATYYVF
jgi:callose synthase